MARYPAGGVQASARVTGRTRVRLLLPDQVNWRSRTLLHRETAGRLAVGTARLGAETVLLRRRSAPVIGQRLLERGALWGQVGFDPDVTDPPLLGVFGMSLATVAPEIPSGSGDGLIQVFDTTLVDPLGPHGLTAYRYESGPEWPAEGAAGAEDQHLREVHFRTRRDDVLPVDGILWFDAESSRPVRAMLRPRGAWRLKTTLRGLVQRIPFVPKYAQGQIDYLELDYAPQVDGGLRPALVRVDGSVSAFWGQFLLLTQGEWTLDWNDEPADSPGLPERFPSGWAFSAEHRSLRPFIRALDGLAGPPPAPGLAGVASATASSLRFNQVQGINFSVAYPFPVGARTTLEPRLHIPTSSFQWTGSVELRRTHYPVRSGVEVYSRLRDANTRERVNGALSSASALLTGYDDGNYYLARGARVWLRYGSLPASGFLSLFAERHEAAPRLVGYSLLEPDASRVPFQEIPVDAGTYVGLRTLGQLQLGENPERGLAVFRVYGQAAVGERDFVTVGTTSEVVAPLPGPFTGAARVQVGVSAGDVPGQGLFYLGGVSTIRGYPAGIASGPSTLIATGEVGTDLPLVRLVAFGEVGWADEARRLFRNEALVTAGGGLSFGDGIVRIDLARGLATGGVWRLHLATSGLF